MKDIYNNQTYLNNNPSWGEEDSPMKVEVITRILKKNNISFKTVAEAGCGSGEILVLVRKTISATEHFHGFDTSNDAFSISVKKQTQKIRFENADITCLDIHVDLLLVIDVLEHIPDYFKFLENIHSKSRYTVFHIPLDMSVWSLFREKMLIESKSRVGHIHAFTEEFILDILEDHGFQIIDKSYTPPTFSHYSLKQKITHGFRSFLFLLNKKLASKTIGGYSIMVLAKNKV
jgi:predicted RNA methylase